MFRLRALSAVSLGLAQLSRHYHGDAVRGSGRRRLMLAALVGVTGASASGGLLWTRAYADAGPSVRHAEQAEEAEFGKEEAESETSVEASSGEEEEEGGGEGKKKKPRSGFRDRKPALDRPSRPDGMYFRCKVKLLPISKSGVSS